MSDKYVPHQDWTTIKMNNNKKKQEIEKKKKKGNISYIIHNIKQDRAKDDQDYVPDKVTLIMSRDIISFRTGLRMKQKDLASKISCKVEDIQKIEKVGSVIDNNIKRKIEKLMHRNIKK
ncbi:hypothetical protein [Heterosigma akashiwo virus 01]|uniref:Uncharacterized protein n=1 Tax=Heterosigma akashiwo virus 01 TaxID=97195 RepID=A0A1C9C5H6_HAV01|nr:hypothetical protein D1R72_gp210 [Heterosigma akashiwo virus 01]AOM63541.1 hypothetical protein [Heterosigma akashiwo virus 01]